MLGRWKRWARLVRRDAYALYLAYRDPRVPWHARMFALCVVAYALSPIDLVPDIIPVLGYLDDLVFVPLGVALAVKLIPPAVFAECRREAERVMAEGQSARRVAARVIVAIWLLIAAGAALFLVRLVA